MSQPIASADALPQTAARVGANLPQSETRPGEDVRAIATRWLSRIEWLGVFVIAAVAVALHLRLALHVGGLWRDEVNSVNLVSLPTFHEIWHNLDYDSFPIAFFILLRGWIAIFGAGNDAAFRLLGCVIGLGVLALLWLNARALGARFPLLSIALVGLNPMIIRYGDSTRAFGLGIALSLLTFYCFWKLVKEPKQVRPASIILTALVALVSVHCLYYNAVLLFATAMGAVTIAARARAWRMAASILGIGTFVAVSLLVYTPMFLRMRSWTALVKYPCSLEWLWRRSCEVTGSPDSLGIVLWVGLSVSALVLVTVRARSRVLIPDAAIFSVVAFAVAIPSYALFLKILSYYTQPWYYIALAAFVAITLDVTLGRLEDPAARTLRVIVAVSLLSLAIIPSWREIVTRYTNVDLIGERLNEIANENDCILVPRWECAITLRRYYNGSTRIVTLPPLKDHLFHRYDLILREMNSEKLERSVFDKLEKTLRAGGEVFLVGTLPFGEPMKQSPSRISWSSDTASYLRSHATQITRIPIAPPSNSPVQDYENLELAALSGWR